MSLNPRKSPGLWALADSNKSTLWRQLQVRVWVISRAQQTYLERARGMATDLSERFKSISVFTDLNTSKNRSCEYSRPSHLMVPLEIVQTMWPVLCNVLGTSHGELPVEKWQISRWCQCWQLSTLCFIHSSVMRDALSVKTTTTQPILNTYYSLSLVVDIGGGRAKGFLIFFDLKSFIM